MNSKLLRIKKHFYLTFIFLLAYYSPVLINGKYYIDDFGRSISGYAGWGGDGRPLAEFVYVLFNFGMPLPDISPLPQVIGIILISIAIALAGYKIDKVKYISVSLCLLPVAIAPTVIANMAYKYDAATMFLSYALAITAATFRVDNYIKFLAVTSAIVMLLSTYQLTIGAYVIFCLLFFITDIRELTAKERVNQLGLKALSLIVGMIVYRLTVYKLTMVSEYANQGTALLSLGEIERGAARNYLLLSEIFMDSVSGKIFYIIAASGIAAFILSAFNALKYANRNMHHLLSVLIVLVALPASYIFIFAPLIPLKVPAIHPRVLISSGAFLALIFCINHKLSGKLSYIQTAISVFFVIYAASTCYAFNNYQLRQHEYEGFIGRMLVDDISKNSEIKSIYVIGNPGASPEYNITAYKYPIIRSLTRILIKDGDGWGEYQLRHYGMKVRYSKKGRFISDPSTICQYKVISYNSFYSLRIIDGVGVIDFNKNCVN